MSGLTVRVQTPSHSGTDDGHVAESGADLNSEAGRSEVLVVIADDYERVSFSGLPETRVEEPRPPCASCDYVGRPLESLAPGRGSATCRTGSADRGARALRGLMIRHPTALPRAQALAQVLALGNCDTFNGACAAYRENVTVRPRSARHLPEGAPSP